MASGIDLTGLGAVLVGIDATVTEHAESFGLIERDK